MSSFRSERRQTVDSMMKPKMQVIEEMSEDLMSEADSGEYELREV